MLTTDRRSGQGLYVYPDGSSYEGGFRDGVFDGLGCYRNRNLWKFEGEFKRYKRDGIGISVAPDASKSFREVWQEARLVDRDELIQDSWAKIIHDRYRLRELLGSGSYGEIYLCIEKATSKKFAIKLERADRKKLRTEIELLQSMKDQSSTAGLHDYGHDCMYEYMVMSLLGGNLNDLRKAQALQRFSLATSASLGIQMVNAIKTLHEAGYVHRDVKPSNFVLGRAEDGADSKVFIIDFGLARRFTLANGTIVPPRKKAGWNGTQRYASIGTHERKELGRHDDLWSWFYLMVQFMKGSLPWCKTRGKDAIGELKVRYHNATLCQGLPDEMLRIMEHLKSLGYYDVPQYAKINQQLAAIVTRETAGRTHKYEWVQ